MLRAQFVRDDLPEWRSLPRSNIARSDARPAQARTQVRTQTAPRRLVCVSQDDQPLRLIEVVLEPQEYALIAEVAVWGEWVVVGCGHALHLINAQTGHSRTHDLGNYFCDLCITNDRLLVSSAERVFCIDGSAQLRWRSAPVAIDGVNLHEVGQGLVLGSGECDPPGGWVGFALDLATGLSRPAPGT